MDKLLIPFRRFPNLIAALTIFAVFPLAMNLGLNRLPYLKIFLLNCCQAFTLAYLFGWLCVCFKRSGRIIFLSVFAFMSFIATLFVIVSLRPLTTESLILIIQTDGRESSSFIHQFVTAKTIIISVVTLLVYGLILWWALCDSFSLKLKAGRTIKRIFYFCLFMVMIVGVWRIVMFARIFTFKSPYEFEQWYSVPSDVSPSLFRLEEYRNSELLSNIIFAGYGLYLFTKEMPEWEKTQRAVMAEGVVPELVTDSVNIVIIIGESFIKGHSNLYGYPLLTNPRLTAELDSGRLTVFNDYIKTANYTDESLRNLLNLNDISQGEQWYNTPYFPLIAAKYGWKVHLYDNQFTGPTHISDVQLSGMMRNPLLVEKCYDGINDSLDRYDGDFVNRIEREFPFDNSVRNLDIFHLYGQHFAPADRYPANGSHDRWTGDSIPYSRPWLDARKRRAIAEYDNATLYNDGVVHSILNRYKDTPAVVIYFSDHGEEMYDASDCNARNEPTGDYKGWLQRQFEIPLFIWASDSYIKSKPDNWSSIKAAASRPGMLDNLGQAVLGLSGIKDSSYYIPSRDILNAEYKPKDRKTSKKGVNYDKL